MSIMPLYMAVKVLYLYSLLVLKCTVRFSFILKERGLLSLVYNTLK